jgi:aminopeptidase N
MKLFTTMFGPPPADNFYATEIPAGHGEAFPGLIHLSMATFDVTGTKGHNEVFRAHEVAHQWWGIGVDFATYRDQWLSEGFSEFAALWYLQTVRGDGKQYFEILDDWKADLLVRGDEAAPIGLGYRTRDGDNPGDYNLIVYEKGAWVLHMLRAMMIDLKTMNEDRFSGMMKDFYQTYRGKRASTDDFQRMVQKHTGQDMGWFFAQWVYHSAIPTYRVAYQVSDGADGKYVLRLRVRQEGVPDEFVAYMPVAIEMGKNEVVRIRMKVMGPTSEMEFPLLPTKPKSVKFNDLDGVLADVKTVGWGG